MLNQIAVTRLLAVPVLVLMTISAAFASPISLLCSIESCTWSTGEKCTSSAGEADEFTIDLQAAWGRFDAAGTDRYRAVVANGVATWSQIYGGAPMDITYSPNNNAVHYVRRGTSRTATVDEHCRTMSEKL
jgi:hypothetical protein